MNDIEYIKQNVDILDYIRFLGYELETHGRGKYHLKNNKSVVIYPNTQTFMEYADGSYGDVIDFVRQFNGKSMKEAIVDLIDFIGTPNIDKDYKVKQEAPKKEKKYKKRNPIILPKKNKNYRRVYAYLCKNRGIDKKYVDYFVKNKMLFEDEAYHNCNFVSYKNDNPNYVILRGTNTSIKFVGENKNNDYESGFYVDNKSSSLIIAESPIDLMSFFELKKSILTQLIFLF